MKIQILTIVFLVGAIICSAQSIEMDVVASSGDYFEGADISLSWTLGEIAIETYDNGTNILTQGFQQPGITLRIYIDLTAFLEGPFNGLDMNTDLNNLSDFPLSQPYNQPPWNYTGTESVGAPPNGDVVDWILIELRETAGGAVTATPGTRIARQAGFVLRDGSIVATDGISNMIFGVTVTNNLHAIVWHRNHLGIMSAIPLTFGGGLYSYDFTTSAGQAYLSGQLNLGGGNYGMFAGDADGNGEVHQDDIDLRWSLEAGGIGYFGGDIDMNSQVNNEDKNDVWLPNQTLTDHVPD